MANVTMRCGALNYYINILPNGDLYPCPYLRFKEFCLRIILHDNIVNVFEKPVSKLLTGEIDNLMKMNESDLLSALKGKCFCQGGEV